ncbi:cytochrome c biogenesis CcdA family protein [Pseudonocardia parietis]|uniref:Cytochrome c biogenesis protein CcdA n=1 Tax=Pseudonocardia parietis TaxID=570936 RepID=A0ABS4W7K5_9PSEU|nr:cytochrome c biogenesis CcdA family protein [Pseudonocardia parietis]MBP2372011.1 cytochrome c biogenesis protein CcdA [Pseudonocardia parietis]
MSGAGLLTAFLGGLLSLLSPCAALLLPSFFAYAFDRVGTLIGRTLTFLAGLLTVLVPLGAGVALVGALITQYRGVVTTAGGLLLIGFGVLSVLGIGFGSATAGRLAGRVRISGPVSTYALGTVYGLAGFCSGPLLGSILTVAAVGSDPGYGAVLLGAYAVGMAAPLFVLALLWDRFGLSRKPWLRGREVHLGPLRTHSTSLISGVLFIGIGLLFLLTDGTAGIIAPTTVDQQADAQSAITGLFGGVSDTAVLLGVVLLALAAMAVRLLRRRATRTRDGEREQEDAR